jgi:hypothetical protein
MRTGLASRNEARTAGAPEYMRPGWLQAGFSSSAYRLAHLCAHRTAVLGALAAIFFFV